MSRCRITAKLRKNRDFCAVTAYLDMLGISWAAHPPKGKGHPYLRVETPAGPADFTVTCTPRGGGGEHVAERNIKRFLASHGL